MTKSWEICKEKNSMCNSLCHKRHMTTWTQYDKCLGPCIYYCLKYMHVPLICSSGTSPEDIRSLKIKCREQCNLYWQSIERCNLYEDWIEYCNLYEVITQCTHAQSGLSDQSECLVVSQSSQSSTFSAVTAISGHLGTCISIQSNENTNLTAYMCLIDGKMLPVACKSLHFVVSHRLFGSYSKSGHLGTVFPLRVMKIQNLTAYNIMCLIDDKMLPVACKSLHLKYCTWTPSPNTPKVVLMLNKSTCSNFRCSFVPAWILSTLKVYYATTNLSIQAIHAV